MDAVTKLHASLDERYPPEVVAALILEVLAGQLLAVEQRVLLRAAQSPAAVYSSMSDDFERPPAAMHKVSTLMTLLRKSVSAETVEQMATDPWLLEGQLQFLSSFVGIEPGEPLVVLPRATRLEAGVTMPGRRYRKLVRHMARTRLRAARMQDQVMLRQLVLMGRSGLAYCIREEEMRADVNAACFVAYFTAQRNRRRVFTLQGRDNPFDVVANMLFTRCLRRPDTDWSMIARVFPDPRVLERLSDRQRGELLGRWSGIMRLTAERLQVLHGRWPIGVDESRMVVWPGADSWTWNTVAQAYNAARAGWLACLSASGALSLLNAVCPGKAMRLMAADLAGWHEGTGGAVDPQTAVWAALPKPWQVLEGAPCTARSVEVACRLAGVDPRRSGWTAAPQPGAVAGWKPTPELVHGVEVSDPVWAGLLRRAGVFSGRPLRPVDGDVAAAYFTSEAATP